jgi:hypothetical protein
MNISVGQNVYFVKNNNYENKIELVSEKIKKIGRKYFYAGNMKIDIDTMTSCSGYSTDRIKVYLSKEEYNNKKEFSQKMNNIERFFGWSNWSKNKITLDEVRQIYSIVEKYKNPDKNSK